MIDSLLLLLYHFEISTVRASVNMDNCQARLLKFTYHMNEQTDERHEIECENFPGLPLGRLEMPRHKIELNDDFTVFLTEFLVQHENSKFDGW